MAIRDHTGRIRSSVPPDDTLTPLPRASSSKATAWPEASRHHSRGDIALAVLALTRLRVDSEQCRHAQELGFPCRPLPWPLPAATTANLGTAIHCLQQYARLLGDEHRVSTPRIR
jgi:hypothetical protein